MSVNCSPGPLLSNIFIRTFVRSININTRVDAPLASLAVQVGRLVIFEEPSLSNRRQHLINNIGLDPPIVAQRHGPAKDALLSKHSSVTASPFFYSFDVSIHFAIYILFRNPPGNTVRKDMARLAKGASTRVLISMLLTKERMKIFDNKGPGEQLLEMFQLLEKIGARDVDKEPTIDHKTVLCHLKKAECKRKFNVCVPHDQIVKHLMDRISVCESLLGPNKTDAFFKRAIMYDNLRKGSWPMEGESTVVARSNIDHNLFK
ncbi:hypothetical protein HZH68_012185 [Vespula germanica]|uniref:Uncharacterized protein n=1 Tax=Vespula germanica TaxID=30212 RepID=A0A834JGH7_VESGE|nr:hypothetical protein HZH68_012185 [Vespula germanica]